MSILRCDAKSAIVGKMNCTLEGEEILSVRQQFKQGSAMMLLILA